MKVGGKGLEEVTLTIPQSTSLYFEVIHKDEQGHTVDHSLSVAHMAFQTYDKKTSYDLSQYVTCSATKIAINLPASLSLPLGNMLWDLIVETVSGGVVRLCYGSVSIVDTYSLDGE